MAEAADHKCRISVPGSNNFSPSANEKAIIPVIVYPRSGSMCGVWGGEESGLDKCKVLSHIFYSNIQ